MATGMTLMLAWCGSRNWATYQKGCGQQTDAKRGETIHTIAGLPIGRVPEGLSSCFFFELLSSADVVSLEW